MRLWNICVQKKNVSYKSESIMQQASWAEKIEHKS